jgi:hypothetical protein
MNKIAVFMGLFSATFLFAIPTFDVETFIKNALAEKDIPALLYMHSSYDFSWEYMFSITAYQNIENSIDFLMGRMNITLNEGWYIRGIIQKKKTITTNRIPFLDRIQEIYSDAKRDRSKSFVRGVMAYTEKLQALHQKNIPDEVSMIIVQKEYDLKNPFYQQPESYN